MKIALNSQIVQFSTKDLPCLIHGAEHSGASLFTITLLSQLYLQGHSVVVLCGYPMAQQEFVNQTKSIENASFYLPEGVTDFISDIENNDSRVALVKNVELFNSEIFDAIKVRANLIISGDLNKCSFKPQLLAHKFISSVNFSRLNNGVKDYPLLKKYEGYYEGILKGVVRVE